MLNVKELQKKSSFSSNFKRYF